MFSCVVVIGAKVTLLFMEVLLCPSVDTSAEVVLMALMDP